MCENAAQFVVKCFSEITVDSFSYHSALGKAMVVITLIIKTHGSVSCGPRKRGVRKRSEYIDRNNSHASVA